MPGRGRQFAIGLAIAVLFPLLVYYGTATVSTPPKYQDYVQAMPMGRDVAPDERKAAQDKQKEQQAELKEAQRKFATVLFYVSVPLGYAAIVGGGMMASAVGTGLLFGGLFAVANGHWAYWAFIPDGARFVSLLIATALVLWVAYRKVPQRAPDAPT